MTFRYLFPYPILPWPPSKWTKRNVVDFAGFMVGIVGIGGTFAIAFVGEVSRLYVLIGVALSSVMALYTKSASSFLAEQEKAENELDLKARAAKIAEALLEAMHRAHFRLEGEEDAHINRVTLFNCKEVGHNSGPRKHLAIFARCGVHKSSSTTWVLDDDHPDRCRGAAGKAWYHETTVIRRSSRPWPGNDGADAHKKEYAESQGITVEEASVLNEKSVGIAAAPVMVHGKKWGVLVLDSLSGDAIPNPDSPKLKSFKAMFNQYAELIGRTLGEAGL